MSDFHRIVETSDYDSDYPYESFATSGHLTLLSENKARKIAEFFNLINQGCGRFWKVVDRDYKLRNIGPDGEIHE